LHNSFSNWKAYSMEFFLLLEAGASIKYVSQRLGHKTIKTTADIYLDVTEKLEEDELSKFASYTRRN
jgi:integrase